MAAAALLAGWCVTTFTPLAADETAGSTARHIVLVRQFLENDRDRVHDYRALRRLSASNDKFHKEAWVEAWTELTSSGFRYRIVDAGGSDYVRTKVLEAALKNEEKLLAGGDMSRADLTRDNYEFTPSENTGDGLVKVLIKPRRRDQALVNGAMFLSAETGDLVRVEGSLAKNPSFWTKRVDMVREYRRVGGIRVVVRVESIAQVKIAGASRFVMTYDYERINGRIVGDGRQETAADRR